MFVHAIHLVLKNILNGSRDQPFNIKPFKQKTIKQYHKKKKKKNQYYKKETKISQVAPFFDYLTSNIEFPSSRSRK